MSGGKFKPMFFVAAVLILGLLLGFMIAGLNATERFNAILDVISIILTPILLGTFTFVAWQNRKRTTKQEKYFLYQSIILLALIGLPIMGGDFSNLSFLILKDIFLIFIGVVIIISWGTYMRRNPELSIQEFQVVPFMGIVTIIFGCLNLFSFFGVYVTALPLLLLIGLTALFMFQDRRFES